MFLQFTVRGKMGRKFKSQGIVVEAKVFGY